MNLVAPFLLSLLLVSFCIHFVQYVPSHCWLMFLNVKFVLIQIHLHLCHYDYHYHFLGTHFQFLQPLCCQQFWSILQQLLISLVLQLPCFIIHNFLTLRTFDTFVFITCTSVCLFCHITFTSNFMVLFFSNFDSLTVCTICIVNIMFIIVTFFLTFKTVFLFW